MPTSRTAIQRANLDQLMSIIGQLDQESRDIVMSSISSSLNEASKRATLNQLRTVIRERDVDLREWVVEAVTESYATGLRETDRMSRNAGISIPDGTVTANDIRTLDRLTVHKQAVQALVADSYLDFGNSMNGLVKGAERQISEALKRQTRARMIAGQLTGGSIQEIRSEVQQLLGDQGFSVLIDRGGKQWTLRNYSEMLARTHIVKSSNEGVVLRASEFNVDIVEVVEPNYPNTDPICTEMHGKIFSISGRSKKYPKLTQVPPFHPNCVGDLRLRPDLQD